MILERTVSSKCHIMHAVFFFKEMILMAQNVQDEVLF